MSDELALKKRQVAFWRLISASFGLQELAPSFEAQGALYVKIWCVYVNK